MYEDNFKADADKALRSFVEARMAYKRASRKRDAAAIADFTSNLLSLVGQGKGLRYDVAGSPLAGKASDAFDKVAERYRKAMYDYRGKIAEENLKVKSENKGLTGNFALRSEDVLASSSPTMLYKPLNTIVPLNKFNLQQEIKRVRETPIWYSNKKQ